MTEKNELKHIAVVMDGNRSWATAKGMPKLLGHTQGAKNLRRVSIAASEQGIEYLTLWGLSTENLKKRGEKELAHLFGLANKIVNYISDFNEYNVKFNTIGDLSKIPEKTQAAMQTVKDNTKTNTGLVLTLAINYGGKDDIIRGIKKLISEGKTEITEEDFSDYLDTSGMPDVDLMIRTSDHQRLSGYLLWQASYAELYFPKIKWPAFGPKELEDVIEWFHRQSRTGGGDKKPKTQ